MHKSIKATWKSPDILEKKSKNIDKIGYEKETAWTVLNQECFSAMLLRCEVPYVCERVIFDSHPKSQFHLTHQLLTRIYAERCDCLTDKSRLVDHEINTQLCAKIIKEAELLANIEGIFGITHLRDLLSEQTAFCGKIGYPNFFQADYLENILSWQSQSDYGCFVDNKTNKFYTNDLPIPRKLTKEETKKGLSNSGEDCKAHLTSVSMMALAMYKEFMDNVCAA